MNRIISLAAELSILAGVIHVFVAPHHWEHWWGYGALFILVGVAQVLFGFALLWWPKRFPPFLGVSSSFWELWRTWQLLHFTFSTVQSAFHSGPKRAQWKTWERSTSSPRSSRPSSLRYSRLSGWPGEGSDE